MKTKKIILLLSAIFVLVIVKAQENNHKSIHQQEQEYYNSLGITADEYYEINIPANITTTKSTKNCSLNKIVFGWHPYWANGLAVNYDWTLLSDLCFFSYEVNPTTGNANNTHGWATSSVVDEALANGVRVSLCVTLFSDHATLLNNSTATQNLISNLISMLQTKGASGVNIDFEGVASDLEPQFTAFLIDLCTQMHTQIPGSIVSVCTSAVDWGNLFNEPALEPYIDYYTIMGYDYYYGGSTVAGPTSPLYTFNTFNYNLAKTVNYYQSQGASRQKLILGLPYYGREWNTESSSLPSNTTSFVSSRTYKAIKDNVSGNYSNRQWEATSFTPYYTYYSSNWRQCFCDDEESLGYKYDLVNMMGIAGIGIWALGNDDGYTELWDLIRDKFTDCAIYPCDGIFYDLGGPNKDYFNNSDYTFTIAPTGASQVILEFPVFDIEAGSGSICNYDYLEIFDGENISSTSLGKFCNTTGNPGTITSSGNALTLKVYTDGATIKSGFKGVWSCIQDNILPETSVTTNEWTSEDFTATFTDTDNEAVDIKFYQVLDNDGVEWRANNDYGFFNDNFQNEIHSDWTNLSGTWSINNGHLMQSDESLSNNNIYTNVTQISGDIYLYHWQMKIDGTGDNRRAGLYFYCSDSELDQRGNSYMIYFRVDQNTCQIYKCIDNTIEIQTDDHVNVNEGVWYDYKVIFNTNTGEIKAYQNDVLASSWTDPSPHIAGNSLSLRTGNCNVEYDDIKVYKNRNSTETITVGANKEVRHQNIAETNSACRIKTIITDASGNFSNSNGTDVNIDWTAPEDIASVNDGLGLDIDTTYIATSLSANWTSANEPNSYITSYDYCIGLTAGASDLVDWSDNGTETQVNHTGLNLITGTKYYFSVRATNIVNLTSNITSSDGILYLDPEGFTIANFEFGNTGICEGLPFSLINNSVNANSYLWTVSGPIDFTSTNENPEFIPLEGEYTVKLVAYGDISNDSVTKTAEITVSPNPIADFSAYETNLALPDATAYFINNSENADLYSWNFGDGETSSQTSPWHTYTSIGLFTVQLEAFSYGCGSDYKTLTDYIHVIDPTTIGDMSETSFSLFPNPASNRIFINLSQGEITLLKIYNASGQIVYEQNSQANFTSIDISNFVSGTYTIEIYTEEKVLTGQVIVD